MDYILLFGLFCLVVILFAYLFYKFGVVTQLIKEFDEERKQ